MGGGSVHAVVVRTALLLAVLGWLATDAGASPVARERVVLADPDPELRHAMEQALAPWHLEVVIEGAPPADPAVAALRADADTARFVVWRDGEQLVVFDRELAFTERRDSRSGTLDPPTAAAAALTIKTMMRLPPPPPPPAVEPAPASGTEAERAVEEERGIELRFEAGVATRIPSGDADVTTRFGGAVEIRPWPSLGLRIGVAGDGGTSTAVDRASFKGTWREWAVLGMASWTYARARWEVEGHAGAGLRRSVLDGTEMNSPRTEADTLAAARAGAAIRARYLRWTLGAVLDVDRTFGTPTYSKTVGAAEIFRVPGGGVQAGLALGVDL
jgi:hypothetical protein